MVQNVHFRAYDSKKLFAKLFAEMYTHSVMATRAQYTISYSPARARANRAPWLVVIPAAISADGRRKQIAFHTEKAARDTARELNAAHRSLGDRIRSLPSLDDLAAYTLATSTLQPYGLTLANAATFAATCIEEAGSLSQALKLLRWASTRYQECPYPLTTLKEAMDAYEAAHAHHADATRNTRKYALAAFYKRATLFCENTYLHDLTTALLRPVLASLELTPQMAANLHKVLRALCTWAAEHDLMPRENPLANIRPPKLQEAEIHPITPTQLRDLLRAAQPYPSTQRYLAICAFAGIRPTEATRLTFADLSPDEPILSVRSTSSKTGGARHVTIRPVLAAWLEHTAPPSHQLTDPLCPTNRRTLRAVKAAAGLSGDAWQADVLRHSFASYALKDGTSLSQLQIDMGHRDSSMLRARYLNMAGLTKALAAEYWSLTPAAVLT